LPTFSLPKPLEEALQQTYGLRDTALRDRSLRRKRLNEKKKKFDFKLKVVSFGIKGECNYVCAP